MELKELQSLKIEVVDSLGNLVLIKGMFYDLDAKENTHYFLGIAQGESKPSEYIVRFVDNEKSKMNNAKFMSGKMLNVPKNWFKPTRIPSRLSEPLRAYCQHRKKEVTIRKEMSKIIVSEKDVRKNLDNAVAKSFAEQNVMVLQDVNFNTLNTGKYAQMIKLFCSENKLEFVVKYSPVKKLVSIEYIKDFYVDDLDYTYTSFGYEQTENDLKLYYSGVNNEDKDSKQLLKNNTHFWEGICPTFKPNQRFLVAFDQKNTADYGMGQVTVKVFLTSEDCKKETYQELQEWLLAINNLTLD